ncbi:hypothetical protein GH714_030163 [Hevea brasiliensis]|uniref:Myb/SANT-like domain-containing protein n=1 Tax=Hevea brasiliensis TaxID=3981 RepID=A0A6A6NDP6_HEVBR|nr:hypothetical protein GH714_030163 [Hevea brasiliensis]
MSAAQDGILGRPKAEWTPSRDAYLVELFIDQHNCGRTAYNEFKNEVIRSVTHDFNKKFGMNLEENQIKNRYNVMKKEYGVVKTLLSHTGFGWDETRQMVVADDKVWDSYIAVVVFDVLAFSDMPRTGERVTGKFLVPSGIPVETEEGNSNTETVRSSEPINLATQVVDGTLDSDSIIRINDTQPRKRKSVAASASATMRAVQMNAMNEKAVYQKCLEDLQKLEELDDTEFTKAVNVLKDDKNAIAFMTIKGPRRLMWLRSLWQV